MSPEHLKEYYHQYYLNHKEQYMQNQKNSQWHDMITCEYCDKTYKRKHHLQHISTKIHTFNKEFGNKPFITCKVCNYTIQRDSYYSHKKSKRHINAEINF